MNALNVHAPELCFQSDHVRIKREFSCKFSALVLAIDGLLAECMEAIAKFKNTTALDASIIAGVQAVAL
jgi:ferritin-like metal-binding protein YciE